MGGHALQVGISSARPVAPLLAAALAIAGSGSRGLAQRWLPRDAPVSTDSGALYYENGSGALVWIGSQMARAQTWALAGMSWNYRDLAVSPPGRLRWATAFDEVRGRAVVFGGSDGTADLNDTWEYDGAVWTPIAPAVAPSAREGHAMAFDPARARTVLFGGRVGNSSLGDTWEFDGFNWVQRSPTNAPGPRHYAAMTYDPTLGACLLVGGISFQGTGNEPVESWTFDGLTWAQLPTTITPRERHTIAFDALRGRSVVYGGWVPYTFAFLDDTWELVGNQWQAVTTTRHPPGSLGVTTTFDPLRGQVVAFGGSTFGVRGSSALWAFDGVDWTAVTPDRMPIRYSPLLAYDTRRERIVLHGGYDLANTWGQSTFEWHGGQWSEVVTNTVPPPLYRMTYDPRRGVIVAPAGAQTYEYDGVDWRAVTTPHAVGNGVLGYDPRLERIVLFEPGALRIYDCGLPVELASLPILPIASGMPSPSTSPTTTRVAFGQPTLPNRVIDPPAHQRKSPMSVANSSASRPPSTSPPGITARSRIFLPAVFGSSTAELWTPGALTSSAVSRRAPPASVASTTTSGI